MNKQVGGYWLHDYLKQFSTLPIGQPEANTKFNKISVTELFDNLTASQQQLSGGNFTDADYLAFTSDSQSFQSNWERKTKADGLSYL